MMMMKVLLLPFLATILLPAALAEDCCEDYCYMNTEIVPDLDNPAYKHFGTKSSYSTPVNADYENVIHNNLSDCMPIRYWSLQRTGASYPGKTVIEKLKPLIPLREAILKNYYQEQSYPAKGQLCKEDLGLLKSWHWNEAEALTHSGALTYQGSREILEIAKRYQFKYPTLLRAPNTKANYKFKLTGTDEIQNSFDPFVGLLFGSKADKVPVEMNAKEPLLQVYEECKKAGTIESGDKEYQKFKMQPAYKKLIHDVSRRLGFKTDLSDSDIEAMYDMCRYDKLSDFSAPSAWCAAFTKTQLYLLEYGEDLQQYYDLGYGQLSNTNLGCKAVQDWYELFDKAISGDKNSTNAIITFSDIQPLELLLVTMKTAKAGKPLTALNYGEQSERKWRTSRLLPYSANFVTVLYQCDKDVKNRYKTLFLLNEKPIGDLPYCKGGVCDWSDITKNMKDIVSTCKTNSQELCLKNEPSTATKLYFSAIFAFTGVLFLFKFRW